MGSTYSVIINGLKIGGGAPIRVESMLKSRLTDLPACINETERLLAAGCELVRVALPESSLAPYFADLLKESRLALMADIHFDHRLALAAIEAGCPSVRINPGNMTNAAGLASVVASARERGVVIRIGANGGSLSNAQLAKCGGDRGTALVLAVEEQLQQLLDKDFSNVIISAKSSSITETIRANTLLANKYPFPLHIGITEAGNGNSGIVKSSIGIALMLAQGIGDTLRVSLTAPGEEEVETGYNILKSLALRHRGWELVSCPTCGRRRVEVAELVTRLKKILPPDAAEGISVAVMGCEVNGPKEAASADLGVAGCPDGFIVFRKGAFVCRGSMDDFDEIITRELASATNK